MAETATNCGETLKRFDINALDWEKQQGLIPAVIQHQVTSAVLMVGYMNQQALQQTIDSGYVTFYSRQSRALWLKGQSSGHYLAARAITSDCDGDSLLVQVKPDGPVCHQGHETCFGEAQTLWRNLRQRVQARQSEPTSDSYASQLLASGLSRCAQKVGEEAVETVVAALNQTNQALCQEAADLLFHLVVLFQLKGMAVENIMAVLAERLYSPS